MTKRRYSFGDSYVVRQMRLGFVTYEIFPGTGVLVHVRGAAPLFVEKAAA